MGKYEYFLESMLYYNDKIASLINKLELDNGVDLENVNEWKRIDYKIAEELYPKVENYILENIEDIFYKVIKNNTK